MVHPINLENVAGFIDVNQHALHTFPVICESENMSVLAKITARVTVSKLKNCRNTEVVFAVRSHVAFRPLLKTIDEDDDMPFPQYTMRRTLAGAGLSAAVFAYAATFSLHMKTKCYACAAPP